MSGTEQSGAKGSKFSMARLMVTILIVILCAIVIYQVGMQQVPKEDATRTMRILGLGEPKPRELAPGLTDADGDMIADAPTVATELVDPQAILFSFIASPEAVASEQAWQPMVDHLASATGKPVQYLRFDTAADQLKAIKEGRLHVTVVNTGNVPEAVTACGFIPVATPANGESKQGYTMKIIVPADSSIKDPAGLKGTEVTFTTADSNSGCKAPMEALYRKYKLMPGSDYHIIYSRGHEQSIRGIASGQYQAAAVASDLLEQVIAKGEVKESDFKTIYTSEQFPALAVGYVYNLEPKLADSVRSALLAFDPTDTTVASNLAQGVTGFAPVSYKDDWALVRRIDESFTPAHSEGAAKSGS